MSDTETFEAEGHRRFYPTSPWSGERISGKSPLVPVFVEGAEYGSETVAARIAAALAEMDRSMYGDPEVPFRMRAILEGKVYG